MKSFQIAALFCVIGGCSDPCSNTLVASKAAPDGRHRAVLFQRDCGTTTGFSTQLSVVASNEEPTGGGNSFRADDDHGAAHLGAWGGPWAEIKWLAKDHLLVRYSAKSRIFEQADEVNGVRLTYDEVSR